MFVNKNTSHPLTLETQGTWSRFHRPSDFLENLSCYCTCPANTQRKATQIALLWSLHLKFDVKYSLATVRKVNLLYYYRVRRGLDLTHGFFLWLKLKGIYFPICSCESSCLHNLFRCCLPVLSTCVLSYLLPWKVFFCYYRIQKVFFFLCIFFICLQISQKSLWS